jgi:tRNA(Arg) A34 adenosine deaminase TadA
MELAIIRPLLAGQLGEVPVGAVIVDADGQVIARTTIEPSAVAIHRPMRRSMSCVPSRLQIKNYRLLSTTLYVTVEPCVMCMGAIVHARVKTVVFGSPTLNGVRREAFIKSGRTPTQSSGRNRFRHLRREMPVRDSKFFRAVGERGSAFTRLAVSAVILSILFLMKE